MDIILYYKDLAFVWTQKYLCIFFSIPDTTYLVEVLFFR